MSNSVSISFNIASTLYRLHVMATLLDAWSICTSKQLITLICFRIRFALDDLILVLSFDFFCQSLSADFQGIKNSTDVFIS